MISTHGSESMIYHNGDEGNPRQLSGAPEDVTSILLGTAWSLVLVIDRKESKRRAVWEELSRKHLPDLVMGRPFRLTLGKGRRLGKTGDTQVPLPR